MAELALRWCCFPIISSNFASSVRRRRRTTIVCRKQKQRPRPKQTSMATAELCGAKPMEGTIDEHYVDYKIGDKVKGEVRSTDDGGAHVNIPGRSAYMPFEEACIHRVQNVYEAGILPGFADEFRIVDKIPKLGGLILSLQSIQYDLAWERCRQLKAMDVVVKGKIVHLCDNGVIAIVEGLRGYVPYTHMAMKATVEELLDKEVPLKFLSINEGMSRILLSNRNANPVQLEIGSVVLGTVQCVMPYGAFIDIGGISGLLHLSQISLLRVSDITTVLKPGDSFKVMILGNDHKRGRVSLSTKKLEPTPGDMITNRALVSEKAEEMALAFRQRVARAEALARADMRSFRPKAEDTGLAFRQAITKVEATARADMRSFKPESELSLKSENILRPPPPDSSWLDDDDTEDLDDVDLDDIPPAERF